MSELETFDPIEFSAQIATLVNQGVEEYQNMLSWQEEISNSQSQTQSLDETDAISYYGSLGTELLWALRQQQLSQIKYPKKRFDPTPVLELLEFLSINYLVASGMGTPEAAQSAPLNSLEELQELYTPEITRWIEQFQEEVAQVV